MRTATERLLICDLTQSYAPHGGGGIGIYLRQKREHILEQTGHRLLQIVPGPEDRVIEQGRHIWVEIGADHVRGSPNYRFILRTSAVRRVLEQYRPDVIESQCPWILPWTAIGHRRAFPDTALVAGYHTDFPNTHVYRVGSQLFGDFVGRGLRQLVAGYAHITYREFDRVYALDQAMVDVLEGYRLSHVDVLSLGVDGQTFHPARRDPGLRRELGLPETGPLLIYAGRIDNEKRADRLITMFRALPASLRASLVMLGDGKLRETLMEAAQGLPVAFPGYVGDRGEIARMLASADIYVSCMADETFGLSVLEAQASGLPVVGFASGAMVQRVPPALGKLVTLDDTAAMAQAVVDVWQGDRAGMGQRAREHVTTRFSWKQTFETLLGEVYPRALAKSAARMAALGSVRWRGDDRTCAARQYRT
ncbi:glycosyltransferase [Novosphingobium sp. AAP93]|uniref:glycosyltransferase n=1 Tax=Novosphingobium sp. AAP93 TaxID=1523427 RepID=UPI0006B89ED6|nr:glycosyltransferase [Novosphingobium sp. AAP93]KPF89796.1 glycosyl transferase family 1 [Novosphingobium sp. AAP93]